MRDTREEVKEFVGQVMTVFNRYRISAFRNISILIIFFIIPCSAIFFKTLKGVDNGSIILFFSLHQVIAGIFSTGCLMAEEKEKHTLAVLFRSGLRPISYFVGIGLFCVVFTLAGDCLFFLMEDMLLVSFPQFIFLSLTGAVCSVLVGYVYGIMCSNQLQVNIYIFPVLFLLGLFPVFGLENNKIELISKGLYTGQIFYYISGGKDSFLNGFIVILINMIVLLLMVIVVYKYCFAQFNDDNTQLVDKH